MLTRSMKVGLAAVAGMVAAVSHVPLYSAAAHQEHASHAFAAGEPGNDKKPFRTIELIMSDGPGTMVYTPNAIAVRKGEQIKFVLKNTGALPHEFLIDSFANNAKHKAAMEKDPQMEHEEPNGRRLEPDKSGEILWRFTKAGTFEFACLIPGHYEAGMKGTVVVK